ncbi:MAG: hypothetical protein IT430_05105 [Phycisphaerales bacterium]|nr:hypothetical protein [Phycisphaerales bacterium]
MKIALLGRHFSGTVGKAHRVDLDHPFICERLARSAAVRLWVDGAEVSQPTGSLDEVVTLGEGRCFIDGAKLWISIPGDRQPRQESIDLVVDVPLTTDRDMHSTARPLLILGPQRCGSTALQWALDHCTPYKAPRDLRGYLDNTLEGFYLTQLLKSFLNHPHYSPFGSDAAGHFWGTGLFQDCGLSGEMLARLAQHIDWAYSTTSGTLGTWTDKCPGWDSVAIAPLFSMLFPHGHVFFLSRDPVGNVLSIMRLRGELPDDLPEERRPAAVAQACAGWTVAHYLWRRYVRPIMPRGAATEISFAKFRRREPEVLAAIQAAANLSDEEIEAVSADLNEPQVPTHAVERQRLDDWVVPAIWHLCGSEAKRWGYEKPESAEVAADAPSPWRLPVRNAFLPTVFHALSWLGLTTDAVNAAAMHFVPDWKPVSEPQMHAEAGAGSLLAISLRERESSRRE